MPDIFVTDSSERYLASTHTDRLLYQDGFILDCSFIGQQELQDFNNSIVGLDDEASRLMLERLDQDVNRLIQAGRIGGNRYIDALPPVDKVQSMLFNFHRRFVLNRYLFELVIDRFQKYFSLSATLLLELAEDYYLVNEISEGVRSASYYPMFSHSPVKAMLKQAYYFFSRMFRSTKIQRTQIAVVLYDIHNEVDLFRKFMDLVKRQGKIDVTIIEVDSGNPPDKRVDPGIFAADNIKIIKLYDHKANLSADYDSFYAACEKINPLYSVFRKARYCEQEDVQYGFVNQVISQLAPDVCLYVNVQEFGRVVANVCKFHNIPSICVEYAFSFDTYNMEKRIRFDRRACISQITAQNWVKHKDPTPHHDIIGLCKMDEWYDKLSAIKQSGTNKLFQNGARTILFISTWAPNPNSPLLSEKVTIVEQLSGICQRHGWNLIIKKHPSEFDGLLDRVFEKNKYPHQRLVEHSEMPLFDCIYYSDFVCTQNSSAFVEALYLNRPFSYITIEGENRWANMSYFSKEKAVGTFSSLAEYEKYLVDNAGEAAYPLLQQQFLDLQEKFLYKTDGKASERLLKLAESFVK